MIMADGFDGINGIFSCFILINGIKNKCFYLKLSSLEKQKRLLFCGWTIFELLIVIMINFCEQINSIIRGVQRSTLTLIKLINDTDMSPLVIQVLQSGSVPSLSTSMYPMFT